MYAKHRLYRGVFFSVMNRAFSVANLQKLHVFTTTKMEKKPSDLSIHRCVCVCVCARTGAIRRCSHPFTKKADVLQLHFLQLGLGLY